jgi:hypothetical protein
MTQERLTRQERRAEVEQAMRAAHGDASAAAAALGVSLSTFYQRAKRAGLGLPVLRAMVRGEVQTTAPGVGDAPLALGDATLTGDGTITLTLADYALLRAGSLAETTRLHRALETADRIIASLTARLEERRAA